MLWKCCTQYASKFGKKNSGHRTGKGQFSFQSQRKQCQRMFIFLHNCTHLKHTSKVMLKIIKLDFNSSWTKKFQMFKMNLEKAEEPEIKLPTCWIIKKAREPQKISTSVLLTTPKSLTVWITTNCGKFFKRWEYQTTWSASWEICM